MGARFSSLIETVTADSVSRDFCRLLKMLSTTNYLVQSMMNRKGLKPLGLPQTSSIFKDHRNLTEVIEIVTISIFIEAVSSGTQSIEKPCQKEAISQQFLPKLQIHRFRNQKNLWTMRLKQVALIIMAVVETTKVVSVQCNQIWWAAEQLSHYPQTLIGTNWRNLKGWNTKLKFLKTRIRILRMKKRNGRSKWWHRWWKWWWICSAQAQGCNQRLSRG